MQIFKHNTNFDFMGIRKINMAISLLLVFLSIVSLFARGLNFGLDFSGGTLIDVTYPHSINLEEVRKTLSKGGYGESVVQHFGTSEEVMIRLAPKKGVSQTDLSSNVLQLLQGATKEVEMKRVEYVGPQVGEDLREQGGLAMLYALICILIYVTFRYEWRFATGAILATFHDVMITLGIFSVFQIEFDLTVLAAVLAIIGYSLNDTIVVFDRIRENFRKMRKGNNLEVVNASINQTLSRTINTSLTTFLVVVALFFVGGSLIHGFSIAMMVGIVVGTYSSIYVASTWALMLGVSKADLMPVKKEGAEFSEGDMP